MQPIYWTQQMDGQSSQQLLFTTSVCFRFVDSTVAPHDNVPNRTRTDASLGRTGFNQPRQTALPTELQVLDEWSSGEDWNPHHTGCTNLLLLFGIPSDDEVRRQACGIKPQSSCMINAGELINAASET